MDATIVAEPAEGLAGQLVPSFKWADGEEMGSGKIPHDGLPCVDQFGPAFVTHDPRDTPDHKRLGRDTIAVADLGSRVRAMGFRMKSPRRVNAIAAAGAEDSDFGWRAEPCVDGGLAERWAHGKDLMGQPAGNPLRPTK